MAEAEEGVVPGREESLMVVGHKVGLLGQRCDGVEELLAGLS